MLVSWQKWRLHWSIISTRRKTVHHARRCHEYSRHWKTLAPLIHRGSIAGISCTGANLEEDVFRMMAFPHYQTIENWRLLSVSDEEELFRNNLNRVTDVCIPEEEAIQRWRNICSMHGSNLPLQGIVNFSPILLRSSSQRSDVSTVRGDQDASWVFAAAQTNLPLFVPGWEDSTMGISSQHVRSRQD